MGEIWASFMSSFEKTYRGVNNDNHNTYAMLTTTMMMTTMMMTMMMTMMIILVMMTLVMV